MDRKPALPIKEIYPGDELQMKISQLSQSILNSRLSHLPDSEDPFSALLDINESFNKFRRPILLSFPLPPSSPRIFPQTKLSGKSFLPFIHFPSRFE